jgi:hypothetical protein
VAEIALGRVQVLFSKPGGQAEIRPLISRVLQERKAALVAPDFASRQQVAVNHSPQGPGIIRDLPFCESDISQLLLVRTEQRGKPIIAGSKEPLAKFGIKHMAPPSNKTFSCSDGAPRNR